MEYLECHEMTRLLLCSKHIAEKVTRDAHLSALFMRAYSRLFLM